MAVLMTTNMFLLHLLVNMVKKVFRNGRVERAIRILAKIFAQNCARYHSYQHYENVIKLALRRTCCLL